MNVKITLRSGYLSRYMNLRVGKTVNGRRWEIQAYDDNGMMTTDITVDGQALQEFSTMRDAMAFRETLPTDRIWATSDRVPQSFVDFTDGTTIRSAAA